MSGRGFRPSERITRATLNRALTAPVDLNLSGPRVNERRGQTVITDEEEIYIRVTGSATSPRRYAWQEVFHDKAAGTWKNTNRKGSVDSDPAFELNNAVISSGNTVYAARRSRASGAWTFSKGGGGGNVDIKSGETVLMLLGTYEQYKDCPDVPGSPPTLETGCGEATTTLCVPAYAYAVYQRCGYVWNKVGDTRDFGVWANELNGGSTSAFRRFVIPRWGGDVDPLTGLPDPETACMGVAFLGSGASALSCSCPPCIDDIECLVMRFRTIPRPCEYNPANVDCGLGCTNTFNTFDAFDLWDKEYEIELTLSGCNWSGLSDDLFFATAGGFYDGSISGCDWGPDVFDPCEPCEHWSTIRATFSIPGGNGPNCGSDGHWIAGFNAKAICNLLCGGDPVKPTGLKFCANCIPFIVADSIEVDLCPEAGTGVGASLAMSVASAYSVPQATPAATAVTVGSFADASIPGATAATPNAGAITAGSTTSAYAVKLAAATAGAVVVGSSSAITSTDEFYPDSFEDL